jgi:SNF2 family DNA or RNA helicase
MFDCVNVQPGDDLRTVGFVPNIPDDLWDHQKRYVSEALVRALVQNKPYYGLFFEQGTGKTRTMVTIMRNLFAYYKRPLKTIIFCPAVVVPNWKAEIAKFSLCGSMVELLDGTAKERIAALENPPPGKHIFVTNFEALDMEGLFWQYAKGKEKIRRMVDRGFEMLIVDEAQRIRNHKSQRAKLMVRLADKVFFRYLLTGTPILEGPCDIWNQYRVLDHGETFGGNFYAFRNEFMFDANSGMPKDRYFPDMRVRPGAEEKMNSMIYTHAVRVEKSECLDLPPLVMTELPVLMGKRQQKAYDDMKRDFIAYLDSGAVVANLAITKGLRMMQILSGYATLDDGGEVMFDDNPRRDALAELLDDHARKSKVIVWCAYTANYRIVEAVCAKLGLKMGLLTGEQSGKQKGQAIGEFCEGDVNVLCSNPAAGGVGINLVQAPLAVWYSRTFSLEQRLQALARNYRGGSEMHSKITSLDLVCEGTIERKCLDALNGKENIANRILGWRNEV